MRLRRLALCFLPAVLAAQSGFDFRAVDRVLEHSLSALTPGVSFTLIVDGRSVYRKSFGNFQPDDRVPIASATKWYSAAVILGVVDRGLLRLDDPASRYIPSFNGAKAGITLRQLLSHTSGLVGDVPCLYGNNSTMTACVDEIAREPLRFTPGTRFSYGNTSMQVAGRMAEAATGKSWRQLFGENLNQPLGMACTTLDAFGSPNNPVVANGAMSCEADYLKFLKMLLDHGEFEGRRVLSAAAVAEMTTDQTRGVPIVESIYTDYGGLDPRLPSLRYGLGTWRERVDPRTNLAVELGSQGATGFSPWIDTERNIAAVFSTRSSQDAIMSTYVALKDAVHQAVQPWAQRSILVTNAASFRFGPVAPGEIVSLFGTGIGPEREAGARLEGGNRFTSELERTRVLFDGQPAPLLYVSWSQISTVIPFSLAGRDRAEVQIERNGLRGPRLTIAVAPAAPGIFFHNTDRGVVLNENGTLNSPSNPARPGSIIVLYATGCGSTSPATPDGELQASASTLRSSVSAAVNGSPATILYAGGAPGLIAGAAQVNLRLDESTKVGDAVPLVLTVAGVASPPVMVSVR